MGRSVEKCIQNALGLYFRSVLSENAALVKADFFFAGVPTIENKIEQKTQKTLLMSKVASAKVAFDTVKHFTTQDHNPDIGP